MENGFQEFPEQNLPVRETKVTVTPIKSDDHVAGCRMNGVFYCAICGWKSYFQYSTTMLPKFILRDSLLGTRTEAKKNLLILGPMECEILDD